jgi:hypothetical protein
MQNVDITSTDDRAQADRSAAAGWLRWVLLVPVAVTGLWALLAPASFVAGFPGFGLHWVAGDGPFNEHMTLDVGALSLALVGVTVAAGPRWTLGVVIGWELYALPHLTYHVFHLDTLVGMLDRVTSISALIVIAVLPVTGLLVERGGRA